MFAVGHVGFSRFFVFTKTVPCLFIRWRRWFIIPTFYARGTADSGFTFIDLSHKKKTTENYISLHIGYGTFLGTSYSDAVMPRLLWSQSWKNTWLLRFANTNHIYLFTSFRSPGGSLANSCPALKRFLITDKNEEIISESVILSCIFLLVDIKNIKSGLLALMKDLSMKRLNSARRLTDI